MLAVELKDTFDLGSRYWCYPRGSPEAFYFKGTIDDAYTICAHIANALGYLEREGIAHNDIKALNILYSREEGATLIDFGLGSTIKDAGLETGGSPWYKVCKLSKPRLSHI
jgi:serine/threonine protein kinase